MIRITSKREGFRRCGIAHSSTSTEYLDGFFTAERLAALRAEPMLVVELCPDLCPEPPPASTPPAIADQTVTQLSGDPPLIESPPAPPVPAPKGKGK